MRRPPATPPSRIGVFRLHGLGDVLMTTPAIRSLRRTWPEAEISAYVGRRIAPALLNNSHVDRVVSLDESAFLERRLGALLQCALTIRRDHLDLLVLFSRSGVLRLWARLIGASKLVGIRQGKDRDDLPWQHSL